ncbi:hypothetical protein BLM37_00325 [Candidatus Gracilibacteria bacterium GN02-873]|nr:hypothetical protein BLM37_00325 [Candidatus Gracilibacteria bacterium GN02-873]
MFGKNMDDIHDFLEGNKIKILYIGTMFCSTCQALFPKVDEIVKNLDFVDLMRVEIDEVREVASVFQVLSAPTILVFHNKKEYFRFSRYTRMEEFSEKILTLKPLTEGKKIFSDENPS